MFENLISKIQFIDDSNGIAEVPGFSVAGTACDIRNKQDAKRLDLALIYSKSPCTAAGTFTTNDVKAAPVYVSQDHLKAHASGKIAMHGIIANSGNANACTGERGMKDAHRMCEFVSEMLACKTEQFL